MSGEAERRPEPPRAPWVARIAMRVWLDERERASVLGDLRELFEARAARDGVEAARRWHARQLRRYPLRLFGERLRGVLRVRGGSVPDPAAAADAAPLLGGIRSDARQAVRGWAKAPVLALTIVLTVGLGIGASTAMFAIVRTVVLHPLPYTGGERLTRFYHAVRGNRWNLSVVDYEAIESQQTTFDGIAAFSSSERTFTGGDLVERVRVRAVTPGWFDLVGIRPLAGRTFDREDGVFGVPRTAVVSHGFWRQRLGGSDDAVGRTIRLDDIDYTVIGVLPRAVGPLEERIDVFPALQFAPPTRKGPFLLTVVGRLREGTPPATAEAELHAINRRLFPVWQSSWQDSTSTWGLMRLDEFVVGRFRTMLLVLLAAVALVLVIASTNAAGLLAARGTQRRGELAARAALGASRARLVRLLVTESVLLASGGGALGLALAWGALRAVRAAGPDLLPRAAAISLDATVLAFALAATLGSLILFGVLPAAQLLTSRDDLATTLRSGGRTASGAAHDHRLRRALVAAQFAVAMPLLVGAGLLVSSFMHLQRVDPGFDGERVFTARISRMGARNNEDAQFWDRLLERVRALPGVAAAGLNSGRPPREPSVNINNFDPLDRPTPPGTAEPTAVWLIASPGYFHALGVKLVRGRMFDENDNEDRPTTSALVDRTWARTVYPGEDPIGRRLYEGGCRAADCSIVEVVGVVEDVRYLGMDDAQSGSAVGTVYVPQRQWNASSSYLYVRTTNGDPLAVTPAVRAIVRELDPGAPVTDVTIASTLVDDALAAPRNLAAVVAGFGAVALLLAMIGIYGVMSFFVRQHRRDIGIRLALGGRPAAVQRLVIARGLRPVSVGIVAGTAAALIVTRFMVRLLYGVSPRDPLTLGLVALAMLATAVTACWLPAREAARVDPVRTLRDD